VQAFDFRFVDADEFQLPAIVRGPADGPVVLLVPPLFEEMNRCRRLLADLGRALAARGIATVLPDLPGTGDSAAAAPVASWSMAIGALTASLALSRPTYVFVVRGGALLTGGVGATGIYRFAPVSSGAVLMREMMRAQAIADQERTGGRVSVSGYEAELAKGNAGRLIGYEVTPDIAAELAALTLPSATSSCRTADLKSGGDAVFEGPPVWRQADPAPTHALADALAADIAAWIG